MNELRHGAEELEFMVVRGLTDLVEVMEKDVTDGDIDLDSQILGSYLAYFLHDFLVVESH